MRGRASCWSNDEIQELAKKFIPAADEVWYLQNRKGPECELFQKMAEHGHYKGRTRPTNTLQGIYACAPSGEFLASINTSDPKRMLDMMNRALKKWETLTKEERLLSEEPKLDDPRRKRGEDRFPEGGLNLRVNSRDLPREKKKEDWRSKAWNQDYLWFRKAEARTFLPEEPEIGAKHGISKKLVERIVCLNLLDNVRGQSPRYPAKAVEKAELSTEVTGIEEDRVSLKLSGRVKVVHKGKWAVAGFKDMHKPSEQERGIEGTLLGYATFDLKKGRFVQFEMVAVGTRWGRTQYNGRADDPGPAPIGFAFTLAGDGPSERVAPANWWSYRW